MVRGMSMFFLSIGLAAHLPVFAAAQTPGAPHPAGATVLPGSSSTLTLAEVLDLAHRNNPSLVSGERHLDAVRAEEVTARLRQNPIAVISSQLVTVPADANNPYFYSAGLSRLFERGNKREIRLEQARSTTQVTSLTLEDQRRQTDLAIRQAFSRMLFAEDALDISRDNLEGYHKTVDLMRVRLNAGDIDQTDFDRVELQLAGFESDMDSATLDLRQASIALQTLIGIARPTDSSAIRGTLDPPQITKTLEDLRTAALTARPDLKVAQAQVDVNQAAVRLAIANGTADPTLESDYERSGTVNSFGASINIPLRIFDRNQGEKQRANYELESSRLALTATQNQVVSDVDTAWAAYTTAQVQAERYRSKYLAEAAHVRDNLEFSYRNGNSTLLDYLSALSDYRQVNLASLNARLNLLLALEQLSYVTNTEIVP